MFAFYYRPRPRTLRRLVGFVPLLVGCMELELAKPALPLLVEPISAGGADSGIFPPPRERDGGSTMPRDALATLPPVAPATLPPIARALADAGSSAPVTNLPDAQPPEIQAGDPGLCEPGSVVFIGAVKYRCGPAGSAYPEAEEDPGAIVSARLELQGDEIVLDVRNLTDEVGLLSPTALIENPETAFFAGQLDQVLLGPRQQMAVRFSSENVQGLDPRGDDWTDARIGFAFDLEDGRRADDFLSLFVESGQAAPRRSVLSSGQLGGALDTPPADAGAAEEQVPVAASRPGTFKICFRHAIQFLRRELFELDHFRDAGVHFRPARGILVVGSELAQPRNADLDGCATFPAIPGQWTFTVWLQSNDWPMNGVRINTRDGNEQSPSRQIGPFVVSEETVDLGTKDIIMQGDEDVALQTALVITQHTIAQGMKLGEIVNPDNSALTIKLISAGQSRYSHVTRSLLLREADALERGATAHEVGHWVHYGWSTFDLDPTYCTPGGEQPCTFTETADRCIRSSQQVNGLGVTGIDHIEWESDAHAEGFAEFFKYLAFNDPGSAPGADCFVPGALPSDPVSRTNCESVGLHLKTANGGVPCYEWFSTPAYFEVGVPLDWAKMYWDLFADEVELGNTRLHDYLLIEQRITRQNFWTKVNHLDQLYLETPEGTPMHHPLRNALNGNVWDNDAH